MRRAVTTFMLSSASACVTVTPDVCGAEVAWDEARAVLDITPEDSSGSPSVAAMESEMTAWVFTCDAIYGPDCVSEHPNFISINEHVPVAECSRVYTSPGLVRVYVQSKVSVDGIGPMNCEWKEDLDLSVGRNVVTAGMECEDNFQE